MTTSTAEYVVWRKAVYERDNYICQKCGTRGGKLEADHIKSFALYPKLRFEVSNGQTLCKTCHGAITKILQNKIMRVFQIRAVQRNQLLGAIAYKI